MTGTLCLSRPRRQTATISPALFKSTRFTVTSTPNIIVAKGTAKFSSNIVKMPVTSSGGLSVAVHRGFLNQLVKLSGHRPGLPGKVISFHIVPLYPACKAGLAGHVPAKIGCAGSISAFSETALFLFLQSLWHITPYPTPHESSCRVSPSMSPPVIGSLCPHTPMPEKFLGFHKELLPKIFWVTRLFSSP
jgi:hypothetical protein